MELYEIVNRYHIGTNYSCAESILLGCEEYYHLHLPEQARKLFTLLGSGMQTFLLWRTDGGDRDPRPDDNGKRRMEQRQSEWRRARGGADERVRAV